MEDSRKCSSTYFKIPPFRLIQGRKYDYPTNERDWMTECKKAIEYKRATYDALCSGKTPPPVNHYYNLLLKSAEQRRKMELRVKHREELERRGVIEEGSDKEVHHRNGVYDLEHAEVLTHRQHVAVHRNKNKNNNKTRSNERSKDENKQAKKKSR